MKLSGSRWRQMKLSLAVTISICASIEVIDAHSIEQSGNITADTFDRIIGVMNSKLDELNSSSSDLVSPYVSDMICRFISRDIMNRIVRSDMYKESVTYEHLDTSSIWPDDTSIWEFTIPATGLGVQRLVVALHGDECTAIYRVTF